MVASNQVRLPNPDTFVAWDLLPRVPRLNDGLIGTSILNQEIRRLHVQGRVEDSRNRHSLAAEPLRSPGGGELDVLLERRPRDAAVLKATVHVMIPGASRSPPRLARNRSAPGRGVRLEDLTTDFRRSRAT